MLALAALVGLSSMRVVTFSFVPSSPAKTVAVVGQFNNWDRGKNPLHFNPSSHAWTASFSIPIGVYQYLFVVDNSKWIRDPSAPIVADANGNLNSELVVAPQEYDEKPGELGDGIITESVLRHRADRVDTCRRSENQARVTLRTRSHDIQNVEVILEPSGKAFPAVQTDEDPLYAHWKADFRFNPRAETRYLFRLTDGKTVVDFGANGAHPEGQATPFVQNLGKYPLPNEPSWVKNAIIYQIFPDRFANGDPSNDGPGVKPWGTLPTPSTWQIRLGGDLQGVLDHLSYLHKLGINCLYFNPIFKSLSNHGYDTVDYLQVDPRFGTNHLLKKLVARAHKLGMHVILDGVFNHVAPEFFAFQDVIKRGENSPYKDWFFIKKFPVKVKEGQQTYETFAGVPTMAKVNQDNPAASAYFLHVAEYWIHYAHIDGWRLDDANEVSSNFWKRFRKVVKKADPEAYIVGEEWGDAHQWLQGDEHDAVMDYRWREALLNYFVDNKTNSDAFVAKLKEIRDDYPKACLLNEFNLIGSHDTPRILTLCQGSFAKESRCLVFQFLYPGVPTIYYGDEIGMEGGHDPDDRRPMIWDRSKWNMKIHSLYKELIHLRNQEPALRKGTMSLVVKGSDLILTRSYGPEKIIGRFSTNECVITKSFHGKRETLLRLSN